MGLNYYYDEDKAFENLDFPVQCGDCYIWYSGKEDKCPACGSNEIVGDRD